MYSCFEKVSLRAASRWSNCTDSSKSGPDVSFITVLTAAIYSLKAGANLKAVAMTQIVFLLLFFYSLTLVLDIFATKGDAERQGNGPARRRMSPQGVLKECQLSRSMIKVNMDTKQQLGYKHQTWGSKWCTG